MQNFFLCSSSISEFSKLLPTERKSLTDQLKKNNQETFLVLRIQGLKNVYFIGLKYVRLGYLTEKLSDSLAACHFLTQKD